MAEGDLGQLSVNTSPCEVTDLGDRFSDIHPLGYGCGGLVYAAQDKQSKHPVSIKKIVFDDAASCQRALREVKIIGRLRHENVVTLHDVLDATGTTLNQEETTGTDLKSILLIQDQLQNDLHQVISSGQLVASHIQLLMYQLLRGLKYIHSANVLHRNLKPANLFVNCDTLLLKIGDFATSRIVDPSYNHAGHLTSQVGTCWYRSPEALLSPSDYTAATDIWSVGCIMAECFVGATVFQGAHELDQLLRIVDGVHLTERDWTRVLRVMPNKLLKNHPFRPRSPLRQRLGAVDAKTVDLIDSLLSFDPKSRLSAVEALQHPYFSTYSREDSEPVISNPFHLEHEVVEVSLSELRTLLIQEFNCSDDKSEDDEVFLQAEPLTDVEFSPVSSRPETPARQETTHTLDQIFQVPLSHDTCQSEVVINTDTSQVVDRKVKTRNARNRRVTGDKTQRNIRQSHSMNIFDVTPKPQLPVTVKKSQSDINQKLKSQCEEDEEKDVADCSPRKIREDLELGLSELMSRAQALALSTELQEANTRCQLLTVNLDQTENFKEYSQPSPKDTSPSDGITIESEPLVRRRLSSINGAVGSIDNDRNRQHGDMDSNKEEFNKKHLKQEVAIKMSRKLILDKIECEKDRAIERSRHHSDLTSEELDELYRLPTDHLSLNRDLSNQSLKNRQVKNTRGRRVMSSWRGQDRDRLKEERFLEGACGGYEQSPDHSDHSEPEDILNSILSEHAATVEAAPMARTRSLYDIDISLDVLPTINQEQTRDPLSSPESPPSPSGGRSGARPKKSPKKQRAL